MSTIYRIIEASFMQEIASTGQPNATATPINQGKTPASPNPQQQIQPDKEQQQNPKNAIDIMTVLKSKGIDVSNPIIAQVTNKLDPSIANNFFNQLIMSANDVQQVPELLTSLLTMSTQLKNFDKLPTILNALKKV